MATLKEIRQQYPMYSDMSDGDFAKAFHAKFYSDLPFQDFSKKIGYLKGANPSEYDSNSPGFQKRFGAQSGSMLGNFRAGMGKGITDTLRGIGQRIPTSPMSALKEFGTYAIPIAGPIMGMLNKPRDALVSDQQVADARARDRNLMDTGSGKAGSITGAIASAVPAAFIPGANTYAGAAAIGGGLGSLQPSTSKKEAAINTATGAVLSPLTMLGVRAGVSGLKATKAAFIDPFTKAGQERIAANTLQSMAGGRDKALEAAANIRGGMSDLLPGVQPTTAELAGNAGLAQLERTLKNNSELTTAFADRAAVNRNAMTEALDSIAGTPSLRAAAVTTRQTTASPLYDAAKGAVVRGDAELGKLMARPSMGTAWTKAMSLASEAGDQLPASPEISGKALHYLKMAMDDLADNPSASGFAGNEARAIKGTRDAFLGWLEKNIPEYATARTTYAELSKPINQMDVGGALRDKLLPAMSDYGAQTRLRPQAFAQALREGDATATQAIGRTSKIGDVMTGDQMATLRKIAEQLGRRVNADELGRAVGSNTGQNLAGQNAVRQLLGPLGLPQNWVERSAGNTAFQGIMGIPGKLAGNLSEPSILKKLAELGLSPEQAAALLERQAANGPGLLGYGGAIAPILSGANSSRQ